MTILTLVRRIAARPSIVFDALITLAGIALWWGPDEGPVLRAETDARVGGVFRVRFRSLDGTELTLIHSRLHDEDTRRSHEEGWSGALAKLQQHFSRTAARISP